MAMYMKAGEGFVSSELDEAESKMIMLQGRALQKHFVAYLVEK